MALVETTGLWNEPLEYSPGVSAGVTPTSESRARTGQEELWALEERSRGKLGKSMAVGTGPAPGRDILWPRREVPAQSSSRGHHRE